MSKHTGVSGVTSESLKHLGKPHRSAGRDGLLVTRTFQSGIQVLTGAHPPQLINRGCCSSHAIFPLPHPASCQLQADAQTAQGWQGVRDETAWLELKQRRQVRGPVSERRR